MGAHTGLIRYRHRKASSATTLTHYGEYVPDGVRWYVALLSFSAGTTDNADIVVSIDGHGYDHVIASQINMTGGEWYFVRPQVGLEAGERLKFYWDGVVNTEVCEVCITGYALYQDTEQGE